MIEEKTFQFTQEEEGMAAHTNLVSVILVTNRYLQEHALDVATFWHFIGQRFATGWTDVAHGDIQEVSRRIALNMASCGSQLESLKIEDEQTKLTFSNWPPEKIAQFFAITAEDAAPMVEVFRPITASLSIVYDWRLEDGVIKIHLKKE